MWDWNIQTGECSYSDTWFRMLGYEPGELTATSDLWLTLVHPDDRQEAVASGDRHINGERDGVTFTLPARAGHAWEAVTYIYIDIYIWDIILVSAR